MAEYGMKATVTAVTHDNDKYEVGFTYSDSEGRAIDKSFGGNMSTLDDDITKALLEVYAEHFMNKQKKADKEKEKEKEKAVNPSKEESRFAELEEENRRLNARINKMLEERENHTCECKTSVPKTSRKNVRIPFQQFPFSSSWSVADLRDIDNFLALLQK